MSNTWAVPIRSTTTFTYLAILPDLPNSNRLALRPQHTANAAIGKQLGSISQSHLPRPPSLIHQSTRALLSQTIIVNT